MWWTLNYFIIRSFIKKYMYVISNILREKSLSSKMHKYIFWHTNYMGLVGGPILWGLVSYLLLSKDEWRGVSSIIDFFSFIVSFFVMFFLFIFFFFWNNINNRMELMILLWSWKGRRLKCKLHIPYILILKC